MPVTTGVFKLDLGLDCDGYVSHNVVGTGTRSALAAVYYVIIALGLFELSKLCNHRGTGHAAIQQYPRGSFDLIHNIHR